jgi:hypothetical protein
MDLEPMLVELMDAELEYELAEEWVQVSVLELVQKLVEVLEARLAHELAQ